MGRKIQNWLAKRLNSPPPKPSQIELVNKDDTVNEFRQMRENKQDPIIFTTEQGNTYTPTQLIGKGGFGHVYMCDAERGNNCTVNLPDTIALKLETSHGIRAEMEVLSLVTGRNHFCTLLDHGDLPGDVSYMIMSLLGPNVSNVRKMMPAKRFSLSTTIRVGLQMLMAIEVLHNEGYISRDIKPSNFAIGTPTERRRMVHMIDFGIAFKYQDPDGSKIRRGDISWRGTTRYCAIANHKKQYPSPRDDLESWFYSLIELLFGKLPWYYCTKHQKSETLRLKQMCRTIARPEFLGTSPFEFDQILCMIDRCQEKDVIDYEKIYGALTKSHNRTTANFDDPYDWEFLLPQYYQYNKLEGAEEKSCHEAEEDEEETS